MTNNEKDYIGPTGMKENEYRCEWCHNVYEKDPDWTDEDAYQETEKYFGVRGDAPDMAQICDDCFNEMHPEKFPERVKEARAALSPQPRPRKGKTNDAK